MANMNGDSYTCEKCGAELVVTKSCGCNDCSITCCGQAMKPKQVTGTKDGGCRCCC